MIYFEKYSTMKTMPLAVFYKIGYWNALLRLYNNVNEMVQPTAMKIETKKEIESKITARFIRGFTRSPFTLILRSIKSYSKT
jgi:hypothetical protein